MIIGANYTSKRDFLTRGKKHIKKGDWVILRAIRPNGLLIIQSLQGVYFDCNKEDIQ